MASGGLAMAQVTRLTLRQWAAIPAPEPSPPEPWRWITPEQLEAAIAQLAPPFATVFQLRLQQRRSAAEIARQINIPIPTVVARLYRGRCRLRQILLADLPPPIRAQVTARR
jgi:DNA-directed RNA polymerase specialized sigma24 family protein